MDITEINIEVPLTKKQNSAIMLADVFMLCFVVDNQNSLDSLKKVIPGRYHFCN